jgi:hypothetical protein
LAQFRSLQEVFKKRIIVNRSKTRVLTFLNIVGAGMGGAVEQNMDDMDPAPVAAMIKKYPELIVGVKTAHFAGPEWIAVDNAVKAGETANVPIMSKCRRKTLYAQLRRIWEKYTGGYLLGGFFLQYSKNTLTHGRTNKALQWTKPWDNELVESGDLGFGLLGLLKDVRVGPPPEEPDKIQIMKSNWFKTSGVGEFTNRLFRVSAVVPK